MNRILKRDNYRCAYCGRPLNEDTWSVDHVIPVVLGGSDLDENLISACRRCNTKKGTFIGPIGEIRNFISVEYSLLGEVVPFTVKESRRGTKGNRSEQSKRYYHRNKSKRREYMRLYMKMRRQSLNKYP